MNSIFAVRLPLCLLPLLWLAGCGGGGGGRSDPITSPPITQPPDCSAPCFVFGAGVSTDEQQLIKDATELVKQYMSEQGVITVPNMTVYAFFDVNELVDVYMDVFNIPSSERPVILSRWQKGSAEARRGVIFINTSNNFWNNSPLTKDSTEANMGILFHEYAHIIQHELVFPKSLVDISNLAVPPGGPLWLIEGFAGVTSALTADRNGFYISYSERIAREQSTACGVKAPLKEAETLDGFRKNSLALASVSVLATDYLLQQNPSGFWSFIDYWETIGRGSTWKAAFQAAFGISIDVFYIQFETYRNANFPPDPGSC